MKPQHIGILVIIASVWGFGYLLGEVVRPESWVFMPLSVTAGFFLLFGIAVIFNAGRIEAMMRIRAAQARAIVRDMGKQ